MLNGLQSLNKNINPVVPVIITIKVLARLASILKWSLNNTIITTLKTTVKAAGTLLLTTFKIKLPLTLSLLGSSASINDGILIVQDVIKLKCIGK